MSGEAQERTRDEILASLRLQTEVLQGLKTDPGFLADLEVFLSKTLDRFDPLIREAMKFGNKALGEAGPEGEIAAFVLGLTEGPALTILERLLDEKRQEIESTHS